MHCARRSLLAGLAILLCSGGLSPAWMSPAWMSPAAAAPTWLTPGTVLSDPTKEVSDVHVVVSAGGIALAVWRDQTGATYAIHTAQRVPGGPWTAPDTLFSSAELPYDFTADIDDAGHAVVAWASNDSSSKQRVRVTQRKPGGAWGTAKTLSGDALDATSPAAALGQGGAAFVAFVQSNASDRWVSVVSSTDAEYWDGVPLAGPLTTIGPPQVAVDATGTPTVAWAQVDGGFFNLYSSSRAADGSWVIPEIRSQIGGSSTLGGLVPTGQGGVAMVWSRWNGSVYSIFVRTRSTAGAWGETEKVPGEPGTPASPRVAVDGTGATTVTFLGYNGSEYVASASSRTAAGAWSDPVVLSGPATPSITPEVVVDESGTTTAIWVESTAAGASLHTRSHSAAGAWSQPSGLGPAHVSLFANGTLDVDSQGDVVVAWEAPGAQHTVAQVAALDVGGPALTAPVITGTAYAGKSAALSVPPPSDAWSAVTGVSWGFGDGVAATGLSVAHTWKKRGSYPVTVTAADAVGNMTIRTLQVPVVGKPRLTKVKLSRAHLDLTGTKRERRTRLSFRLDTAAKVVVKITGEKRVRVLRKRLDPGKHSLVVRTTIKGVHLSPGKYRVLLVATNPAGKGQQRKQPFTVRSGS